MGSQGWGGSMQRDLSVSDPFAARHIGPSSDDQRAMLATLGYETLDDLIKAALPAEIPDASQAAPSLAKLPAARTETQVLAELRRLASRNTVRVSMIGLGYYATNTPAVIRRNVLENPAWYTAYTPYQPEISQGRLEALLNFQTMVCDLTALPVANASLLDEASAAAEAMTLARRVAPRGAGATFLADADCLPQTLDVLRTRAEPLGIELRIAAITGETDFAGVFGVLLQYPGASGEVRDLGPVIEAAHAAKATVAVAADVLALTMLKPPGELGADVAIGSTQRFGVPMGYGGPHAAYMAVREDLKRQLPGRLVGVSVDADGRPALRLALQAREQHIRREKGTSNICTAQVLLAVAASMYAVYHGPDGLTAIARHAHRSAMTLAATLKSYGLLTSRGFAFDTISVQLPGPTEARAALLRAKDAGYNLCEAGGRAVRRFARGQRPGRRRRGADRGRRGRHPRAAQADLQIPHPPGVQRPPQRDRHAPLPAAAFGSGRGPRPVDDPARLVHHEAERGGRDGGHHLA